VIICETSGLTAKGESTTEIIPPESTPQNQEASRRKSFCARSRHWKGPRGSPQKMELFVKKVTRLPLKVSSKVKTPSESILKSKDPP